MPLVKKLSKTRLTELRFHAQREAKYNAERKAIATALTKKGRKMYKRMGHAEFRVNDRHETPIYYEAGTWHSPIDSYQKLIDRAIAGI